MRIALIYAKSFAVRERAVRGELARDEIDDSVEKDALDRDRRDSVAQRVPILRVELR